MVEKFLKVILRSEELKSDQFLVFFLSGNDQKYIDNLMKQMLKTQ